ncbi:hypothetical protein HDV00_001555 [Rhizophlyctis rosea]|nr:hypothetical protein HDV00_001555 [Rhizophlyctis rosea]
MLKQLYRTALRTPARTNPHPLLIPIRPKSTITPPRPAEDPKDAKHIPTIADKIDTSEPSQFSRLNILAPPPRARLFSVVGNNGFTIGDLVVKGPLMVIGGLDVLWDVPQYGVGGPEGATEGGDKERWNDPHSPFHGWTTDMFKVLELVEDLPGEGGFRPPAMLRG